MSYSIFKEEFGSKFLILEKVPGVTHFPFFGYPGTMETSRHNISEQYQLAAILYQYYTPNCMF